MSTQKSSTEAEGLASTLQQRGSTYGDFAEIAELSRKFREVCSDYLKEKGKTFPAVHGEALVMIFHKISRALAGDPNYVDNWHDIAGYSSLVERHINKENENAKAEKLHPEEIQAMLGQLAVVGTQLAKGFIEPDPDGGPEIPHISTVRSDPRKIVLSPEREVQAKLDGGPTDIGPLPDGFSFTKP